MNYLRAFVLISYNVLFTRGRLFVNPRQLSKGTLQVSEIFIFDSCSGLLFYCEEQLLLLLDAATSNCSSEAISEYQKLSDPRVKELSILPMFQSDQLSENKVRQVRISSL